jgi:tetratricopeptide (TPR) repeat protein
MPERSRRGCSFRSIARGVSRIGRRAKACRDLVCVSYCAGWQRRQLSDPAKSAAAADTHNTVKIPSRFTVFHNNFMLSELLFLLAFQTGGPLRAVEALLARGEYGRALEQLSSATPKDATWHLFASKAYDGLNDAAKAVAEAENALSLDPKNPAHHLQLAQIFLSRNTPKAALEILNEAVAMFPDAFVIRLGRSLALKELHLYQDAEQELLWCLARQPSSALVFDALATVYLHQSRYEDARKLATAFVDQNAADYRGYYFLAAAREAELLPAAETKRLIAQSLERNPTYAASHALMGKLLLREDDPHSAVTHLKKAIEVRPDLVQAHLHLARAHRALGDEVAAAREFAEVRRLKAKEQQPAPSLRYHRGQRDQK